MHTVGLHSALAINRQRKRRDEQKKARDRRFSSQSTESGLGESRSSFASPRNSVGSIDRKHLRRFRRVYSRVSGSNPLKSKVVSGVGMLHIGVVFVVLGTFLIGSGLIPDDMENWGKPPGGSYINELVVAGSFALGIGLFLILLNKIITAKEEDDLSEYVQRQLTRTKSGQRLVRDLETGCLTTKRDQRAKQEEEEKVTQLDTDLESITPVHFSPTLRSPPPLTASTPRSDLERILEEELSEKGEEEQRAMERLNKEALTNGSAVLHNNDHDTLRHHTPHHKQHHHNTHNHLHHHHQTQPEVAEYSIREEIFETRDGGISDVVFETRDGGIPDGVYETRELTARHYSDLAI